MTPKETIRVVDAQGDVVELEIGEPMSWTGEHALEALNAGLPPGQYGEIRRPKHPPFRVTNVKDGVVTMARCRRWTASFAWNLYESLFELGAVPP